MFNNPPTENRAVYEIMWKNMVEPDITDGNIIRRMCFACWITKVTDTHSEYIILFAFARQQMFTRTRLSVRFVRKLHCLSYRL